MSGGKPLREFQILKAVFRRSSRSVRAKLARRPRVVADAASATIEALERRQLLTTVTAASFNYLAAPQGIQYGFSGNVSTELSLDDFVIDHLTANATLARSTQSLAYNTSTNVATITFPGQSGQSGVSGMMPDGNFQSILSEQGVPSLPAEHVFDLYFLIADANRDRAVGINDYGLLAANFNSTGKNFSQGDFDLDGDVDTQDYAILAANYGRQMPTPITEANKLEVYALSSSSMQLNWTAPDDGTPDGYRISRGTDGINFTQIAEVDASTFAYTDTDLVDGTKYWYRIRPFTNANGNGETTQKMSAVTVLPAPVITSVLSLSDREIEVDWDDESTGTSEYLIEARSANSRTYEIIAVASSAARSFVIDSLEGGVAYNIRLRGRNQFTTSTYTLDATVQLTAGLPSSPTDLMGSSTAGGTVFLTWKNTSRTATSVLVEAMTPAEVSWHSIGELSANQNTHTVEGLIEGKAMRFRVTALNIFGASTPSNIVSVTTRFSPPDSPADLSADGTREAVTLTWRDLADNESEYVIEERASGGSFAKIGSVPNDVTTFVATRPPADGSHEYRVAAQNEAGISGYATVALSSPFLSGMAIADPSFSSDGVATTIPGPPGMTIGNYAFPAFGFSTATHDGGMLILRYATQPGYTATVLTKLLPNGDVDTTFGINGHFVPQQTLLTFGTITAPGTGWGPSGISPFIKVLRNHQIIFGAARSGIWRLSPNGQVDETFGDQGRLHYEMDFTSPLFDGNGGSNGLYYINGSYVYGAYPSIWGCDEGPNGTLFFHSAPHFMPNIGGESRYEGFGIMKVGSSGYLDRSFGINGFVAPLLNPVLYYSAYTGYYNQLVYDFSGGPQGLKFNVFDDGSILLIGSRVITVGDQTHPLQSIPFLLKLDPAGIPDATYGEGGIRLIGTLFVGHLTPLDLQVSSAGIISADYFTSDLNNVNVRTLISTNGTGIVDTLDLSHWERLQIWRTVIRGRDNSCVIMAANTGGPQGRHNFAVYRKADLTFDRNFGGNSAELPIDSPAGSDCLMQLPTDLGGGRAGYVAAVYSSSSATTVDHYAIGKLLFSAQVDLLAHRTGGRFGKIVDERDEEDSSNFLILTNNDGEESVGEAGLDYSDTNAEIPAGSLYPVDDDLARITIKRLGRFGNIGTLHLEVSNPSAVRLFKSDGTLLANLALDFASPLGNAYLADLAIKDVDVWIEGLLPDSNLRISLVERDGDGFVISRDDVKLTLAEWKFANPGGDAIGSAVPVWKEALSASLRRGLPLDMDALSPSLFKTTIEGTASLASATLEIRSTELPSDYYDDVLTTSSEGVISRDFGAFYSSHHIYQTDSDAILSSNDRAAIEAAFRLHLVHNSDLTATLTTAPTTQSFDVQSRRLEARTFVEIELKNDVVNVGGRIRGTVRTPDPARKFSFVVETAGGQTMQGPINGGNSFDFDFPANVAGDIIIRAAGGPMQVPGGFPGQIERPFDSSALVRVLPAGQTMPLYARRAWDLLHVNGVVSGDPLNRNRRISELYANMYNRNPALYKWAGMAAHASYFVGDAMAEAEKWMLTTGDIPGAPDPKIAFELLAEGNLAVYDDIFRQHLAYDAGGMVEIDRMSQNNEIAPAQRLGWLAIDEGTSTGNQEKIWNGNQALLDFEQRVTLQTRVYAPSAQYWAELTNHLNPMVPSMASPVPDDNSTFQTYRSEDSAVPDDASLGNFPARWAWIVNRQLPAFKTWSAANASIDIDRLLAGFYKRR